MAALPTSLIVVADREGVKAYRVDQSPKLGARLQLVQAFETTETRDRPDDNLTGRAGSLPASKGTRRGARSIAGRRGEGLDFEDDQRICQQLAAHIVEVVKRERAEGFSLAAPASIHKTVSDLLPSPVRRRVVEHVRSDLVKIEPSKLPGHFRSLQSR